MELPKMFTPKTFEELEAKIAETKQNGETWDCDLSDLNVTEIIGFLFSGCSGLTSVVIPEGVTLIGESAFYGCSGLTSIKVAEGNKVYDSRESCNAIIETATNKLVCGCEATIIPEGVTEIGVWAFGYCTGLTSVVIPEGVTTIGERAFSGCKNLKEVTLPVGVKKIDEYAFEYCRALETIYVPASFRFRSCCSQSNPLSRCCLSMCKIFAKKAGYYKKRLPEELHNKIKEIEPVKKAKKK